MLTDEDRRRLASMGRAKDPQALGRAVVSLRVSSTHGHGANLSAVETAAVLAEIDHLRAELRLAVQTSERVEAAAYAKAAEACRATPDRSGVNDDGRTWLVRATKYDCAAAIDALAQAKEPTR